MSLPSGPRAITTSTLTVSKPQIRALHHDPGRRVRETDDPIDPLAAERPGLAAVEAEQRKKPDCLVEVLDDKADVDEVGDAGAIAVHRGRATRFRSPGWRGREDIDRSPIPARADLERTAHGAPPPAV